MSERITQCPRCQAAFRVTPAQLEAAAGAVRCGACRHIFDASDRRPADSATSRSDTGTFAGSTGSFAADSGNAAADDERRFDDRFGDDPADDDPTDGDVAASPAESGDFSPPSSHNRSFLDLEDWEEEPRSIFSDIDKLDSELENDEQWVHELLRELEDEDRNQVAPQDRQEPGQPAADPPPAKQEPVATTGVPLAGDATWTAQTPPAADPDQAEFAVPAGSDLAGPDAAPADPMGPVMTAPPPNADASQEGPAWLLLEPGPLELARRTPRRPARNGLYFGISVLGGVLLAAQYLFFEFDQLALGPQRPQLAQLCGWLNCALPQRSAPGLIRTDKLVVRSHPDQPGALAVDAVITNQAAFAQGWPHLRLTFSDLDGTVIASRSFQADDYLAGELAAAPGIPSGRPVHIALELVDPGSRAVNYELYLEAPTPSIR